MFSSDTVVKLDGISISQVDGSVEVDAVDYHHEALDSVPVVRLVRTDLIEAENATAEVVGLTPAGSVPVGFGANRVVGFPGWAVINDPEHASIALSLVPDLQKAEKLASTRPKKAKESSY